MFSQYHIWLSVFVAMHRTLRFLLSVSGIKSEYIGRGGVGPGASDGDCESGPGRCVGM